ncbi:MAG: glycoside hydrolase family 15 protein [Pseudomonadota bacterium]
MPLPIESYALIGDFHTAALVGLNGSIDWLSFPRFDSGACFAALLGQPQHGHWLLAPTAKIFNSQRRYRPGTLILETDFETDTGAVRIIDFMAFSDQRWDVVRIVEGLHGHVSMKMELVARFDYGAIVPWIHSREDTIEVTAGPDTLELHSAIDLPKQHEDILAEFSLREGERIPFVLNYRPSYRASEPLLDAEQALTATEQTWQKWCEGCTYDGRWRDEVERSLITLKALIYAPSGGIIAAPTTSLPEHAGGVRNWDYRYCWLRDATFTLNSLVLAGYHEEAIAWREWLLRAAADCPEDLQILYSVTGERRLEEYEIDWLPGYQDAIPVRVGNAAANQLQLGVYGEIMDSLHVARHAGLEPEHAAWQLQLALLKFLESNWQQPDNGIWEMRGPRRQFTHSKVMTWVAFDRAIKDAENFHLEGPVERWRTIRDAIHKQVCTEGYDAQRNTFVQFYGSSHLDASLLLIPQVGFLPPDDPRVVGTIEVVEHSLLVDGLVLRYKPDAKGEALPNGEGAFLPCCFWLAGSLALIGRHNEGEALFERLLALSNDLGLVSEEYDTHAHHMLGNFPQALTHMALINTAYLLSLSEEQIKRATQKGERPTPYSVS